MQKSDGMHYAPRGKSRPVVLARRVPLRGGSSDHGHIYGMSNGLIEAGATLKWVYDPDPERVRKFVAAYPKAKAARSKQECSTTPRCN